MMRNRTKAFVLIAVLLFGCAAPLSGCADPSGRIPVVIDTDPGVDDVFALILAAGSGNLDIRGITSVQGNVNGARTAFNALALASYLGIDCAVARGADLPLERMTLDASLIHGNDGLGGASLPLPTRELDERSAAQLIYDEAVLAGGKLQLLTFGPLTNVATAFMLYPELPGMLAGIVMMGGSSGVGNTTIYGEYNIYNDPEAAAIVFESGVPIVMVGLNATKQAYVSSEELRAMYGEASGICDLLDHFADYMQFKSYEAPGKTLHDMLAAAYLIDSSVATSYRATVTIDTSSGERRGQTVVTRDDQGDVTIVDEVDQGKLREMMRQAFATYAPYEPNGEPMAPTTAFTAKDMGFLVVAATVTVPTKNDMELTFKVMYQDVETGSIYVLLQQKAPVDNAADPFANVKEASAELHIDNTIYTLESSGWSGGYGGGSYVTISHVFYLTNLENRPQPISGNCELIVNGQSVELPAAHQPRGLYTIEIDLMHAKKWIEVIPLDERGGFWIMQTPQFEEYPLVSAPHGIIAVDSAGQKSELTYVTTVYTEQASHNIFEVALSPNGETVERLEYSSFQSWYFEEGPFDIIAGESIVVGGLSIDIISTEVSENGELRSFIYNPNTVDGRIGRMAVLLPDGRHAYVSEPTVEFMGNENEQPYNYISAYIYIYQFEYLDFKESLATQQLDP